MRQPARRRLPLDQEKRQATAVVEGAGWTSCGGRSQGRTNSSASLRVPSKIKRECAAEPDGSGDGDGDGDGGGGGGGGVH